MQGTGVTQLPSRTANINILWGISEVGLVNTGTPEMGLVTSRFLIGWSKLCSTQYTFSTILQPSGWVPNVNGHHLPSFKGGFPAFQDSKRVSSNRSWERKLQSLRGTSRIHWSYFLWYGPQRKNTQNALSFLSFYHGDKFMLFIFFKKNLYISEFPIFYHIYSK